VSALATILVRERSGRARVGDAIRIGVPLARGALTGVATCSLTDSNGVVLPAQFRALATWPDGSVKWLLVDALVAVDAQGEQRLAVVAGSAKFAGAALTLETLADRLRIDTGAAVFDVPLQGEGGFARASVAGVAVLDDQGLRLRARGKGGREFTVRIAHARVEESGPLRTTVLCTGALLDGRNEAARLALRLVFLQGSASLRLECEIWNPRAARHIGGLWDLGDAGSVLIEDISLEFKPSQSPTSVDWQATPGTWTRVDGGSWSLYQDSSGGEQWNSPNHVDANGALTVSFRGYRVHGANGAVIAQADRATPSLRLQGASFGIAATVEKFWQNFPKALRWRDEVVGIGLFPAECRAGFELQAGEKKRHTVLLDFAHDVEASALFALHAPLEVSLSPEEAAATAAVAYLLPAARDRNTAYLEYLATLVDGQNSCVAKREIIDEYGWRNFGDLYADHEAVHHHGKQPFISHYNNQYDFVYGAGMQFLRTADNRWRELMEEAARHLIDIDIYRTSNDKAGFNGGMFWHTDHYQPAATCTHRTYSRKNAKGPYGGGPSNEHDYTSGLLQYFYLTGDPQAADTIRLLADWVIAMDDGSRTLLGLFDDGPTGHASNSRDADFHKPGRGAGNSINALLDAYAVTRDRRYVSFAEQLLQRVIHPHDDVASLGLDQPETRWSYVVFLQVLGKYLDKKLEWGETDYLFWYARAGLLTYARWMLAHEQPYKDVLHKVELPTETWPAHDVRKCHVFHVAACYAPPAERAVFTAKAVYYFDRCLGDLLSFPTAYVTRPQVILCTYGVPHGYYLDDPHPAALGPEPDYDYGKPVPFLTQGARLKSTIGRKVSNTGAEFVRLIRDRWRALLARAGL
jgi:hypothetical protein